MSIENVTTILAQARNVASRYGKEKISARELQEAWDAARAPEAGDAPGKPLSAEEARLFQALEGSRDLTPSARRLLTKILGQIPSLVNDGATPGTIALPSKRGHDVAFAAGVGFVDPTSGRAPADDKAFVRTLYHAGAWVQASFGTDDNLFAKAGLDPARKRDVLTQLCAVLARDLSGLTGPQREQLLGSTAAVCVELIKSIERAALSPTGNREAQQLQADAFTALSGLLRDERLSALVRRSLVGYLQQSDSFGAAIDATQKATIDAIHAQLFPRAPADYGKWDAAGKSVIRIDHVSGEGENFHFGFVKQLLSEGIGDPRSARGYKFELVSGSADDAPAVLRVTIPKSDTALNKWGRDMVIEIECREYRSDMYKGMSDPNTDVVSYGGHSNFGGNTLSSLANAPEQKGDKIITRDLCAGVDTKNAEAHRYPQASINSITSVNSSYFRTTTDPQRGKYAYESEGYLMLMSLTRGLLGKRDWDGIGADLARTANWWGHDSSNNWSWPTDPRGGSFLDDDFDGIPNAFDLMPSYNTTDVEGSTAKEFEMKVPNVAVDEISGARAFQALQFVNTATNYNDTLQDPNARRNLSADPNGLWFDGREAPTTYARFRKARDGKVYVQLSSALANMTLETQRTVLYVETVRWYASQDSRLFAGTAERNAMALLFAASSLEYDQSWRDRAVFDGVKKLYGFPDRITWDELRSAVAECETRHNYTGDRQAVTKLLTQYRGDFSGAGVGEPAVAVS